MNMYLGGGIGHQRIGQAASPWPLLLAAFEPAAVGVGGGAQAETTGQEEKQAEHFLLSVSWSSSRVQWRLHSCPPAGSADRDHLKPHSGDFHHSGPRGDTPYCSLPGVPISRKRISLVLLPLTLSTFPRNPFLKISCREPSE